MFSSLMGWWLCVFIRNPGMHENMALLQQPAKGLADWVFLTTSRPLRLKPGLSGKIRDFAPSAVKS
jgi:hypothetical protein